MAIESYFEDIADAIRERGGTSATLTPAAMPQAILDIPGGGGGGITPLTPAYEGLSYGYIADGALYGSWNKTNYCLFYQVENLDTFVVAKTATTGNRFQVAFFHNRTMQDMLPYINEGSSDRIKYNGYNVISYYQSSLPYVAICRAVTTGYPLTGVIGIRTSSESIATRAVVFDGADLD